MEGNILYTANMYQRKQGETQLELAFQSMLKW